VECSVAVLTSWGSCFHVVAVATANARSDVSLDVSGLKGPITIAIRARFEHDTTSYEELCAFEQ